jgi:large subunit ribosomal protein L35
MPKMKTKRAAKKRVKMTASGKLKRYGAWKQHLLEGKSPKRRRGLSKGKYVSKADTPAFKVLVPYI